VAAAVEVGKGPVVGAPSSWPLKVMIPACAYPATRKTAAAISKHRAMVVCVKTFLKNLTVYLLFFSSAP